MKTTPSSIVKKLVIRDIRLRNLSQRKLAEMTGLSRQTIATILGSNDYFPEKYAMVLSNALGYNKSFLTEGDGQLIAAGSPQAKDIETVYYRRMYNIYKKVHHVYELYCKVLHAIGSDDCEKLTNQVEYLSSFLKTLDHMATAYGEDELIPLDMLEASEHLFNRYYGETMDYIRQEYVETQKIITIE